jgi:hypothetical protein
MIRIALLVHHGEASARNVDTLALRIERHAVNHIGCRQGSDDLPGVRIQDDTSFASLRSLGAGQHC